jgi:hypothetical protein
MYGINILNIFYMQVRIAAKYETAGFRIFRLSLVSTEFDGTN